MQQLETINSTAKTEAVSVETEKHKYDQANWTNLLENMRHASGNGTFANTIHRL
jgi:hypothetical protein